MAKDKFKQMQQEGTGTIQSFQEMASTVAAIEHNAVGRQATDNRQGGLTLKVTPVAVNGKPMQPYGVGESPEGQEARYMRLPPPAIPVDEYNLISACCASTSNMTRMDWVELAFVEKLYHDKQISEDYYQQRRLEITSRPQRGKRKGMKKNK